MPDANGRELGQGEEWWSRDKLARQAAMPQFIAISHFASISPLKLSLAMIPLTWEVRFTLHNFLLPPFTIQQLQQSCLQEL